MANRRISEFPLIGGIEIDESDLLTLVHVFEVDPVLRNKKITFSGFKDYLNQYYTPSSGGVFNGNVTISGNLTVTGTTIASSKTPASATDTGTTGEICWDSDYIYVAVGTNTWKRAALSTW